MAKGIKASLILSSRPFSTEEEMNEWVKESRKTKKNNAVIIQKFAEYHYPNWIKRYMSERI